MKYGLVFLAAAGLGACFPSSAFAEERPQQAFDSWFVSTTFISRFHLFGYEPSKVLSYEGEKRYVASEIPGVGADFRLRTVFGGKYAMLVLEPYTVVPSDIVRVNIAGLELTLLFPVNDWLRFGMYHHSSHNFSDGSYGWGTDLNAFVVDTDPLRWRAEIFGERTDLRLRLLGHWYWTDHETPHVLTRQTDVDTHELGRSQWRAWISFSAAQKERAAECGVDLVSPEAVPSALRAQCHVLFRAGPGFLGQLGEHAWFGPFLSYGQNFHRVSDFGRNTFVAGLRGELTSADNRPSR